MKQEPMESKPESNKPKKSDENCPYVCSTCKAAGIRLWRGYMESQVELACARCAIDKLPDNRRGEDGPLDPDGAFTYREGDQIGWLVPAVPTEEGDSYWGYTSVPDDRVQWWQSLPTYADPKLEVRCLRHILQRTLSSQKRLSQENQRLRERDTELTWQVERQIYVVEWSPDMPSVTIWGSATQDLGNGTVLRFGQEQVIQLQVGMRIAIFRGRAFLMHGDRYAECPSILDHDQDGDALVARLMQADSLMREKDWNDLKSNVSEMQLAQMSKLLCLGRHADKQHVIDLDDRVRESVRRGYIPATDLLISRWDAFLAGRSPYRDGLFWVTRRTQAIDDMLWAQVEALWQQGEDAKLLDFLELRTTIETARDQFQIDAYNDPRWRSWFQFVDRRLGKLGEATS